MRILIIEDDKDLCELIALNLESEGYKVDICHEGDDGLRMMKESSHDLILLDRMLPYLDGMTLLRMARREKISTPVLMLTALGGKTEIVEGLNNGADDYIEKPFDLDELLARVRALCRRPREYNPPEGISYMDLKLDTANRRLSFQDKHVSLSKRESDLLEILIRNPGQTLPRSMIFSYVWGVDAEVEDGNLDNYISYVRDRLRESGCALLIKTVRGVGYRLEKADV